ncbi:hypothetical protein LDL59_03740 [Kaistella anthropi]|nr:hypothetical protein [Kaistella anthropi]
MRNVVASKGLQTNIVSDEGLSERELYGDTSPIIVRIINEKKNAAFPEEPIAIQIKGGGFVLSSPEWSKNIEADFNKMVSLPFANIMISKNPQFDPVKAKELGELSLHFASLESRVNQLQKETEVNLVNKDATVIGLGINYPQIDKAKDLLDNLVLAYNMDAIDDKKFESKKTLEFIEDRIAKVAEELEAERIKKKALNPPIKLQILKRRRGLT